MSHKRSSQPLCVIIIQGGSDLKRSSTFNQQGFVIQDFESPKMAAFFNKVTKTKIGLVDIFFDRFEFYVHDGYL